MRELERERDVLGQRAGQLAGSLDRLGEAAAAERAEKESAHAELAAAREAVCGAFDSNSGHQLLRPPAEWCPKLAF